MKVSGQARNNGVDFSGENYKVSFRLSKGDNVSIKHEKHRIKGEFTSFLRGIPILRTIAFFIDTPMLLLLLPLMILGDVLLNENSNAISLSESVQLPLMIGLLSLNVIILIYLFKTTIWKLKETWKYHGAEHKTIYAVKNNVTLDLAEVRKCPRVAGRCGTNFVMFFIFFSVIFFILGKYISALDYVSIKTLAAFIIANELFDIDDGEKKPILKYFYKMGFWQQQHLLTSEPTDIQLQAAISAMKVLVELEADESENQDK